MRNSDEITIGKTHPVYVGDELVRVFVTSQLSTKNSLEETEMGLNFHFYTFFFFTPYAGTQHAERGRQVGHES